MPASARRSPGWGSAPPPRTSVASLFETVELDEDIRRALLPVGAGLARPGRPAGHRRAPAPSPGGRAVGRRPRRRRTSSRTRASPASGPTARSIATRRGSSARSRRSSGFAAAPRRRRARRRTAPRATVVRDAPPRPPAARRVARCRLDEVESARSIARRFVVSAMSVGALSPEAHQALTIGIQRAGGAANTGEGGEDPGLVRARPRRRAPRRPDQAGRVGPLRRDRDLPRPRRAARDQDRPGLEAGRGRPAARRRRRRRGSRRSAAASPG